MDVSIIIINYNTFELTCKCIESIYKHTQTISFEIILVDNASTECSPALFLDKYPSVKLIKNTYNAGFAAGNNIGIAHAEGDIILLLNSDTELLNNAVEIVYNRIMHDSSIGVITSQLLFPDGRVQSCCNRFPSVKLELLELFRLQKLMRPEKRAIMLLGAFFNHTTSVQADWVWATFFMFRKEILQHFSEGKLPEDFFMYGEDMQWCYEVKKKLTLQVVFEPTAQVRHYLSSSTNQVLDFDKQKTMAKHEYTFLKKYYGSMHAYIIFKIRALKYASLFTINIAYLSLFKLYINSRNYT